jgi:hypothetical protein
MKNLSISALIVFIAGGLFAILIISCLASCATPKWYARTHDGCQSSQGMAGYGNK